MIRVEKETAPAYWASYLVNGDSSGISNEDVNEADRFIAWLDGGHVVSCEGEPYFGRCYHSKYAGDLLEYVIHYHGDPQ